MLLQLDIHNIALIDEVSIELGEGLNVLTGETGAGKSIIIDSINAVLGGRVSKDLIRTGSEKALVEAAFQIENEEFGDLFTQIGIEPEDDGTLILSREITQSGRSTCRANGKLTTASVLKALGEKLIDLHGQHDNQSLLKTESQLELLDSFGGERICSLKNEYQAILSRYKDMRAHLKALSGDPGERERKIDLLRFQIDEIEKSRLKADEEENLNKQRLVLSNAEKIAGSLSNAYNMLSSGEQGVRPAVDLINEAISQINNIARFGKEYEEMLKHLQDILYQFDDTINDIRNRLENIEYNPALLEEIEERLDLIHRLKRKYGNSIPEIISFRNEAEKQLGELQKSEETVAMLRKSVAKTEILLYEAALRLSEERKRAASLLEDKIGRQLDELEMKNSKFKANIQFIESNENTNDKKYMQNGLDRVEFLISANPGEPLKPLAKIASGGEMSRIMLAIKTILAEVDKISTLIFDEIDMGISGRAAQKVGEKLSLISNSHQVICVTHLAQIASMADNHYLIEKITEKDCTKTIVSHLDGKNNIIEIARLIGGITNTDTSLKYAEEMLKNSTKIKK